MAIFYLYAPLFLAILIPICPILLAVHAGKKQHGYGYLLVYMKTSKKSNPQWLFFTEMT